jgi:hypothetical protein
VRFQHVEVDGSVHGHRPEHVVVIRELREEQSEEKTCRYATS